MPAITLRTRKMLWGRSAGLCAICKKQLVEDERLSDDPSILGQECHIVGEENTAKSPRGLNPLPLDERNRYDNLILLCRDHHKIIDDQPDTYTVDELHRIKNEHISWVQQTLVFDEAKQLDDETYMAIAEKWAELAGLKQWDSFVDFALDSSPKIRFEYWESLGELLLWLETRVYPSRYAALNGAFENFKRVLKDFREVFLRHAIVGGPDSDPFLQTDKFYHLEKQDARTFQLLLDDYRKHKRLLCDLVAELTRAANYVCELIRANVDDRFRLQEGTLQVRLGVMAEFEEAAVSVQYRDCERIDLPYPGIEQFMSLRFERDYHFGKPEETRSDT